MTKPTASWRDVKAVLSEFSHEQLLGTLQDVYKLNPATKSFFHSRFLGGAGGVEHLEAYKKRIRNAISTNHTRPLRLGEARKAVNEFKKASGQLEETLELMLYYVECGNDFTLAFGDITESFYNSLESMFNGIVQTLIKQKDAALAQAWLPKLEREYKRVSDFGWGYADYLSECLEELREAFSVK
jgi:hypothetical protein